MYELRTGVFQPWRQLTVDMLPLNRGETVLDVGCGTGLCLPLLQQRVGPEGEIVAIDRSAEMLTVARDRATAQGWHNVSFVEADVAAADIPVVADAALFCAVHDIVRSPFALRNVVRHLRPGAGVAASGGKWAPPWMVGLNVLVRAVHQPYVSSFAGFDRPWSRMEEFVEDVRVRELASGGGYLAVGRAKAV